MPPSRKPDLDPRITVCIPAYNEAQGIGNIVRKALLHSTEVIVCDDGSTDSTAENARAAGAIVVRHQINRGYGSAVKTLFRTAKERDADIMVTIDSDGQHDPEQIPIVLQPILNGECDVVIGSRFLNEEDRKKVPGYRSFGIKTITKLVRLTSHHNLTDGQSGFRAYSKVALSKIELAQEGMAVSTEILMRAGQKNLFIKEVPITIRYDIDDTSTHNPFTHGLSVVGSIIRFVSLRHPLAFYGIPGIGFLVLAGIFMTNAVDLFSQTRYISTNMIILSVGSAVMGVMLLVTGVILYSLAELLRERLRE